MDKTRLLNEAQANDPTRADLWKILLASTAAEQADAEAHSPDGRGFESLEVRELSSLHMGRLILSVGGDLACERVSEYYTGKDGKVHIVPKGAADPSMDGADVCEGDGQTATYRWHGRVLWVAEESHDSRERAYSVSTRDSDTRWTSQCMIRATYGFTYRATDLPAYGSRTPAVVLMSNPHNVFMAAQVDAWGKAYRPYYDTSKPATREAIQAKLFADYIRTHTPVDFDAFKAAIARSGDEVLDTDLFIPVDYQGATLLVHVQQGWLRQEPQPNIEFDMYAFRDGQAIEVGALDTEMVAGPLEKLTISPN